MKYADPQTPAAIAALDMILAAITIEQRPDATYTGAEVAALLRRLGGTVCNFLDADGAIILRDDTDPVPEVVRPRNADRWEVGPYIALALVAIQRLADAQLDSDDPIDPALVASALHYFGTLISKGTNP